VCYVLAFSLEAFVINYVEILLEAEGSKYLYTY